MPQILKQNLELIEIKGDIFFYRDSKGKEYQKVLNELIPIRNGSIAYRKIKQVNGYVIKYNTNGMYGYVIFRSTTPLEDGFWTLDAVEQAALSM